MRFYIQYRDIQVVSSARRRVKDLPHHVLPFEPVGSHLTKTLKYHKVTHFVRDDMLKESLTVVRKQHRIEVYPVLLEKGRASVLPRFSIGDNGDREGPTKCNMSAVA